MKLPSNREELRERWKSGEESQITRSIHVARIKLARVRPHPCPRSALQRRIDLSVCERNPNIGTHNLHSVL